jgi:hypothetical protein
LTYSSIKEIICETERSVKLAKDFFPMMDFGVSSIDPLDSFNRVRRLLVSVWNPESVGIATRLWAGR